MTEFNRKFTPAEIRRMMGMTIEEMAKALEMSHMTLKRREAGESDWKATEIRMISDMSQIPIDRIIF